MTGTVGIEIAGVAAAAAGLIVGVVLGYVVGKKAMRVPVVTKAGAKKCAACGRFYGRSVGQVLAEKAQQGTRVVDHRVNHDIA